jgi:single-strand DNA-binding protein
MARSNGIEVTIRGRVVADPILHYAQSGAEYTRFNLATTPREQDRVTGAWGDGQTEWIEVTVLGRMFARNVGVSLHKGQPVIVTGTLSTSPWIDNEGSARAGLKLRATAVGHDQKLGRSDYIKTRDPVVDATSGDANSAMADAAANLAFPPNPSGFDALGPAPTDLASAPSAKSELVMDEANEPVGPPKPEGWDSAGTIAA